MRVPWALVILCLLPCARPAAAGTPRMFVEETEMTAGARSVNVKVFLSVEKEMPPLFLFGVGWDGLRLQLLEVNWNGTIFQANGGPPFHTVKLDPEGKPLAGVYTVGFCDPCLPLIPAGDRVPIANLRFARAAGFLGEESTAVRLVRAPPLGSTTEEMEPRLYDNGWLPVETADGLVRLRQTRSFVRSDSNFDETVDISDAVKTLAVLFQGGESYVCRDAADSNDDGAVDISDAIHTLSFLFTGGAFPPAPFPVPEIDPTPDRLGCDAFPCQGAKLVFEEDPEATFDFVEFCIPDQKAERDAVVELYPEVTFLPGSAGRIGCGSGQLLCIIDWASVDHWKLCALSQLPYLAEVRGSFFE